MLRKVISMILVAILLYGMVIPAFGNAGGFADIPDDWSRAAIEAAISNGLFMGSDGLIKPDNELKRSEMAAIITRAFGAKQKADISKFTDIPAESWYADELAKAAKMGVFTGDGDKMRPEDPITRQESFVVLSRALKLSEADYSSLDGFVDKSRIDSWAMPGTAALVRAGYVNGNSGRLNPGDNISRAEFAQMMFNILKTYISKPGTYTSVFEGSVMINAPDVTLRGLTVKGDLIIGDGVGTGSVMLDDVRVEGRTVIRGGGKDSIHVINGSSVTGTVIIDNVNNEVRIVTDAGTKIQKVDVGSRVVLEGSFGDVRVVGNNSGNNGSNAGIEIKGNVQSLSVETKAEVSVKSGTVAKLDVSQTANGTTINAEQDARIEAVTAYAQTSITGSGTVVSVMAKANDIKVDTAGTKVTADNGVTGVTAGGKDVSGGTTATSGTTTTAQTGGGGGGGGGGYPSNPLTHGYYGDYTISSAGTYGPYSGTATVTGSVYVNAAGVTLQNLAITGNLTLGAGIASGDAYINNVTVQGRTIVQGGGSNSIHIQGASNTGVVEVDDQRSDKSQPINIAAEGTGSITAVNIKSTTTVKITPVTDTIGYVVAVDGSTVTYDSAAAKKAELFAKIIAKADSILDASITGNGDANIQLYPDLSALTANLFDTSQYGIWALKYYINPLDGVSGYENDFNRLEAKLELKGRDTDLIDLRDHPGNFVATMYDKWFPGQGSQRPENGLNQGMLNNMWDTYSRFITLKKYEVNGSGIIVTSAGNTDSIGTQTAFIAIAQTLYGKLKLLQNDSAVSNVIVVDEDGNGLDVGDRYEITFKRRLKPGVATEGKNAIASLISSDNRFASVTASVYSSVYWSDSETISNYGSQFQVTKLTIYLGDSPNPGLLGGTFTIPKDKFGSYVPDGYIELHGEYGAYITNYKPLFDIGITMPSQVVVPHVPALNAGSVKIYDRGSGNTGSVGFGDTIELAFTCKLADTSINRIKDWINNNNAFGTGTGPGEKMARDMGDPNVTKLEIRFGNNPSIRLGDTFTLSKDDIYDPTGLKAAGNIQITVPGTFSP